MSSRLAGYRVLLPAFASVAASTCSTLNEWSRCDGRSKHPAGQNDRIVFLGTGSSTGCPRPLCPMVFQKGALEYPGLKHLREGMESNCRVSNMAIRGDPRRNKNYRNNPSLVLGFTDQEGTPRHIIIDVGKTFREGAIRWFPETGVTGVDAVILTHEHADAVFGLDDIRGVQGRANESGSYKQVPMPVYLSKHCLKDAAGRFPWLFPNHQETDKKATDAKHTAALGAKPTVKRYVASLDVHVLRGLEPVNIHGLRVVPLPVMHGEDLVCYGYAFTLGNSNIVYLSDISRMLPETLEYIQTQLPPTDVLIIDSLHPKRDHPVHYSLKQAMKLRDELESGGPKKLAIETYIVGVNCDAFPPHEMANIQMRKEYGRVQLAYDGQVLNC